METTRSTTGTTARGLSGWSRRGKIVITLMLGALCVEAAMAYQQIAYSVNPCKMDVVGKFVTTEGGCKDAKTGRVWSRNAASRERGGSMWSYSPAVNYCSNLVEGGYDDWRLPTRDEMKTVAANGAGTHLDVFGAADGTTESDFPKWSSTTVMVKSPGYRKGEYAYVVSLGGSGYDTYQWWSTKLFSNGGSATDVVCVRQ